MNTRDSVMQSIIFHDVLGKRILALDQIKKGLTMLGVNELLENNIELFKPLFCFEKKMFTSDALLQKLKFVNDDGNSESTNTHAYFLHFIKNASIQTLEKFCLYCTGSACLPFDNCIKITYNGNDGFVASTCLLTLQIPVTYSSKEHFAVALNSILTTEKAAFSTV